MAELVLTEGALGMKGAIDKANELASQIPDSFIAGQFEILQILLLTAKQQVRKYGKILTAVLIFSLPESAPAALYQVLVNILNQKSKNKGHRC